LLCICARCPPCCCWSRCCCWSWFCSQCLPAASSWCGHTRSLLHLLLHCEYSRIWPWVGDSSAQHAELQHHGSSRKKLYARHCKGKNSPYCVLLQENPKLN
jgi:hypothetical protein